VLAIGCHPDDLEIGCGGTLARYVKNGHKVFMCHITNGDLGHVKIMPKELGEMRNAEAASGAKLIGAESITLDIGDGKVDSHNPELVKKVIEVVRHAQPDVILTHAPDDYMTDHVETGLLAFNGSFMSSVPHHDAGGQYYPKIVPIYYMDTLAGVNFIPTEYVDVSETIEVKLSALACHDSQIKWMAEHDHIDFIDFVRTCSKYRGLQCGVQYAEGFRPCLTWPRLACQRLLPLIYF
jgi:N-acetylglucosamine malate deacetylase 1